MTWIALEYKNSSVFSQLDERWIDKKIREGKCVTLVMFRIIHSSHLAYFERESGAMTNVFFPFLSRPSKRPRSRMIKERDMVRRFTP